jgi:hypothetical protein
VLLVEELDALAPPDPTLPVVALELVVVVALALVVFEESATQHRTGGAVGRVGVLAVHTSASLVRLGSDVSLPYAASQDFWRSAYCICVG